MVMFVANQQLRAAQMNALHAFAIPLVVVKTADEEWANFTIPQDDNELFLTVTAHAAYRLNMHLLVGSTGTVGDILFRFNAPPGSRMSAASAGLAPSATGVVGDMNVGAIQDVTTFPTEPISWHATAAAPIGVLCAGTLIVGSLAGTLRLQWSQATATAAATIVKAGSSLGLSRYA